MSITLKRPMFRKGGEAEEGIMELATSLEKTIQKKVKQTKNKN